MKTLKFMLAAATAIGLASATQADQYNTTGFEKLTVGDPVTTGVEDNRTGYSYFYYAGATAEDNESVIAAGTPGIARPRGASDVDQTRNNILQVSTGTDPLLRTYKGFTGTSPQAATAITGDLYVDTLVQFTVTPYTDTVTPSNGVDKLLIYLKETTNEVNDVLTYSTNLVVVGGFCVAEGDFVPREYTVSGVEIEPNTWHRLTVKVIKDFGELGEGYSHPAFQVFLDGDSNPCVFDSAAVAEDGNGFVSPFDGGAAELDDATVVFSLLCDGSTAASLQGVGFAGEGKVDDIVFSTLDPFATVYDFTFAFDSQKVSAVTYTVGGTSYDQARAFEVEAGTEVAITSITYADAWMAGTLDAVNLSDPVSGVYTVTNAGASLTITPEQFFPRTNTADQDGTAAHPYEVADAAAIVALQKGLLAGKNITGKNFVQTGNIDMTGVTDFYGIGWFESSTSFASVPPGVASDGKTALPFAGTYDGAGYTISNVTIVKHSYAGLFNNVSGTVKNLTVQDIGLSGTCSEWGCAIVGNAGAGSLLENLTAVTSSGFDWGSSANHNVAGIVVRPIGAATIRGCVNNANISSVSKRLGGIASFVGSGTTGTVFDSCTNNATLVSTDGTRGVGGILGCAEGGVKNSPTANDTIIRNCADFGSETAQNANGHAGAIVGSNWNESYTYTDDGGNTFKASTVDCGYVKNAVFGRAYAVASTIDATDYLTTVKAADLAAGNTYTLLDNIAASETPVFTLTAAGDTIAFDTSRGFTFAGTVADGASVLVSSDTVGTVTTYTAATAVAKNGATKYATFKDAVDAANAGDTVEVLADCTVAASVSFTKNVTVSNDYTIAANVNYALCIGATVTFEGSGMIQRGSDISGSAFCVGANETTRGAITAGTAGTLVFNGGTVCGGSGGNQIKLENGTVEMNGGVLKDGLRGIKADADKGSYTSAIVINGGTITNCSAYAVYASAESATGTATITINGGVIAGPIGKAGQVGTESITIPGTSTAKFDRDQSSFCASGYETTLADGWYVVTAVAPSGFDGGATGVTFDIPAETQATLAALLPSGKTLADVADAASGMTYAQAYALGLMDPSTGDVEDLKATIEVVNGKVKISLDDADAGAAYTVTLKVYEKASLAAEWPSEPKATYALGSEGEGFTPGSGSATAGFYKVEVTVSNK